MALGKTYYIHELQLPISHNEMLHLVSSIPDDVVAVLAVSVVMREHFSVTCCLLLPRHSSRTSLDYLC